MTDKARLGLGLVLLFLVVLGVNRFSSCGPDVVASSPTDGGHDAAKDTGATYASASASADTRADLPSRCTATTGEVELPDGESLEVGGAELSPTGITLAASLSRDGGRRAAVFQVDLGLTKVRAQDLGDLGGGDLAPHLATCAACDGHIVVATYTGAPNAPKSFGNRPGSARIAVQRTLVVSALEGAGAVPLVRVPQQSDESSAFDLLLMTKDSGVVAWDEDSERVVRGVVKVASFAGGKLGEAVVVSPYETDADAPKLARTAKGELYVAWIAREVLSIDGGVGDADLEGAYLEAPGEERAHQWVEIVALDGSGKPRGAPLAVTSRGRGFAASFELLVTADGVDVIVVDGAVQKDGLGSRILRVPVRGGKPGASHELVGQGSAASANVFGPFVTFVDVSERAMVVTLDAPHVVSREPLARGGRFVASTNGSFYSVGVDSGDGGASRAFLRRHTCP